MSKHMLRRILAAIGVGAFVGAGIVSMPAARADDVVGCQTDGWGFLGLTQKRELCDGPIHPDGSWLRRRVVYTPAHQVPLRTNCYGYSYISCTTTGGYYQPYSESDHETYPVTADTVLADEPGHLNAGAA